MPEPRAFAEGCEGVYAETGLGGDEFLDVAFKSS